MISERKKFLFVCQLALLLPLVCANLFGFKKVKIQARDRVELIKISSTWNKRHHINAQNEATRALYASVNPSYLHTALESLTFSGGSTKMQFIEKECSRTPFFQERREEMASKVSVDFSDLKTILDRIEGHTPGKPHLIISDFTLKKKGALEDNLYDLDLQIIKRDYSF